MKKFILFISVIFIGISLLFSLPSCKKNRDVNHVKVSQQVTTFSNHVRSQKISIESSCAWNIKGENKGLGTSSITINWIEVTPYFGDKGSKEIVMNIIPDKIPTKDDSFKIFIEDKNGNVLKELTIEYKHN